LTSVYDLKPRFQELLRPTMQRLSRNGFTPNTVTVLASVGSLVVGALLLALGAQSYVLAAVPAWLFARMALNAIDGMMARELGQSSDLGAVLNELGDVVSDSLLYLPLAWAFPDAGVAAVIFVLGAVVTEFCGLLGKALGASRRYDGPMGKSDRALVVGTMCLVVAIWRESVGIVPWVLAAAAVLTFVTSWNRIAKALRQLDRTPAAEGEL